MTSAIALPSLGSTPFNGSLKGLGSAGFAKGTAVAVHLFSWLQVAANAQLGAGCDLSTPESVAMVGWLATAIGTYAYLLASKRS